MIQSESDYSLSATITSHGTAKCQLITRALHRVQDPIICFSMMAPGRVLSGGTLIESLGGFCAVRLQGVLNCDNPISFEMGHADPSFRFGNRAWLPLGAYLRFDDGMTAPVAGGRCGLDIGQDRPDPAPMPDGMLALVPQPTNWQPDGGTLIMSGISLTDGHPFSGSVVAADQLAQRTGLGSLICDDGIPLVISERSGTKAGAYHLHLGPGGIRVETGDRDGAFYALVSLLQLRRTYAGNIPTGIISDTPRFEWRGQHLDCARHYYQPETIFRLFDLMALLKLNRFHWHFADDEAFRLQVDCAPALWQKSQFRGEGQTIPGVFGGGAGPYGGSYSKETVRQIIEHAKDLSIEVMPEIEFPAHALTTAMIFPELRDPQDSGTEVSVQGYQRNSVNPALPETWKLFTDLVLEISALFPFAHLHLGGDELPPNTWSGSPAVHRFKTENHLQLGQDVMGMAMQRLAQTLGDSGIVPCAWEEAALGSNGGIANGAKLFSWTSQGPGLEAARRGYDVVMCPAQHIYLDMAHTPAPSDWGANWAATIRLKDTIAWDPVPEDEPELRARILGVQGAFWSEFTTQDHEMEPMLAPRILGIATKAWSNHDFRDPAKMALLTEHFLPIFYALNWQVAPERLYRDPS